MANRLAFYGGRFLENLDNFKAGMELLDSFHGWYSDMCDFDRANQRNNGDYKNADTLSKLNINTSLLSGTSSELGLETMIFQDIAADPKFNLKKRGEDAFGFKNNAAMRFFGRDAQKSIFGTVFNMPPEKRRVLFAAHDAIVPLVKDSDTASFYRYNKDAKQIVGNCLFVSRVLNKSADLERIARAKGKLTAKDVFATCFPEIDAVASMRRQRAEKVKELDQSIEKAKGAIETAKTRGGDPAATAQKIQGYERYIQTCEEAKRSELAAAAGAKDEHVYSLATLNHWYKVELGELIKNKVENANLATENSAASMAAVIKDRMAGSGCTIDEAFDSFVKGTTLPLGNIYQTGYSMALHDFPKKGLEQVKVDLTRGTNYTKLGTKKNYLELEAQKFGSKFPETQEFAVGDAEGAETVVQKVRELCGEGHELQAQIVGMNLTQAASGPINGAFKGFKIYNDEHAVLDYSLSKDAETGAVTIRYSSPKALPRVSFSWTCTVNTDGTCTTTPMTIKEIAKSAQQAD